jgi:hypothetical protein
MLQGLVAAFSASRMIVGVRHTPSTANIHTRWRDYSIAVPGGRP